MPGEGTQDSRWTRFTQQRLKAWQPIFAPRWIIAIFAIFGLAFIGLGTALLQLSQAVTEYVRYYTDDVQEGAASRTGSFDIEIERDMEPPIWIYYQLDGFHQNHRRYVTSRDSRQMHQNESPITRASDLICNHFVTTDGRVNYPCGLVPYSVFNDTYMLQKKSPGATWEMLQVDSRASTIAWPADTNGKYRNVDPEGISDRNLQNQVLMNMWILQRFPPQECRQKEISESLPYEPVSVATREATLTADGQNGTDQTVQIADCTNYRNNATCRFVKNGQPIECTGNYEPIRVDNWGIESGHFLVWMRLSGLPSFRKLWGRIDSTLQAGTKLRVHFSDYFPAKKYHGQKAFIISTSSVIGGKNDFLGGGYIVVGSCCLLFGAFFACRPSRPAGDLSRIS